VGVTSDLYQSFNTYNMELTTLFEMMFRELEETPEGCRDMFLMILKVFLAKVKRLEPETRPLRRSGFTDQITSVINYIAQAYHTDITVEQLARDCNMSVSYFRKVFRDNLGMCPQQYLIHVRLSMAEHLLRTTHKQILAISEEVGFRTLSSFNRLFKKQYGYSPRALR
jgi:AraC-like DNA-binding protein